MSIPLYASQTGSMWKNAGSSVFQGLKYGVLTPTIFGYNQIKGSRPKAASCCVAGSGGKFSRLTAFYPTIWSHPLQTILIKNYSYGGERGGYDNCCDNTIV